MEFIIYFILGTVFGIFVAEFIKAVLKAKEAHKEFIESRERFLVERQEIIENIKEEVTEEFFTKRGFIGCKKKNKYLN